MQAPSSGTTMAFEEWDYIWQVSCNFLFPSCYKRKEEERNSLVKCNNGWVLTLGSQISINSLWPAAQKYSDLISESLPNLWSPWISFGHSHYLFPVRLIKLYTWKNNSSNLKELLKLIKLSPLIVPNLIFKECLTLSVPPPTSSQSSDEANPYCLEFVQLKFWSSWNKSVCLACYQWDWLRHIGQPCCWDARVLPWLFVSSLELEVFLCFVLFFSCFILSFHHCWFSCCLHL